MASGSLSTRQGGAMVAGSPCKPDSQSDLLFTQVNTGKSITSVLSQAASEKFRMKFYLDEKLHHGFNKKPPSEFIAIDYIKHSLIHCLLPFSNTANQKIPL